MSVVSALQVIIHAAVWLSVIADEREKWVDLDWISLQRRGCIFGGLKGRFHGQHFKLISWIKQLNQNPCLFTRQGLCKNILMYQHLMTNAKSLLETTHLPLKAYSKQGGWHFHKNT